MTHSVNQAWFEGKPDWFAYEYERPAVTADIVCIYMGVIEPQILVIQRKNPPYQYRFAFPGGFMSIDETLIGCAKRELMEETGIIATNLQFVGIKDTVFRDTRSRVISATYLARFNDKQMPVAGDDAVLALWLPLSDVRNIKLAFDHNEILEDAINALHL